MDEHHSWHFWRHSVKLTLLKHNPKYFEFRFKHKHLLIPTTCSLFQLFGGSLLPADLHCIRREWVSTQWSCTQPQTLFTTRTKMLDYVCFTFLQCHVNWCIKALTAEASAAATVWGATIQYMRGFLTKTEHLSAIFFSLKSFDICYMTAAFTNCSLMALERQQSVAECVFIIAIYPDDAWIYHSI